MSGAGSGSMLKLAMLGDGGVGKTALVIQLCLNKFVETYDPTIEDSYRKRVLLDEHAITLELMDTAGQEEYLALQDQWIRDGEGFLLAYSVTQRMSFMRIKQYYKEIQRIKDGEPFGVVLVGNKVDQAGDRQVSSQEGEQLARAWGVPFYETSAKMNINAEVAFLTLARITRDKRSGEEPAALAAAAAPASPALSPPAGGGDRAAASPLLGHMQPPAAASKQPEPVVLPAAGAPPGGGAGVGAGTHAGAPHNGGTAPGYASAPGGAAHKNTAPSQAPPAATRKEKKKSKKGKCVVM